MKNYLFSLMVLLLLMPLCIDLGEGPKATTTKATTTTEITTTSTTTTTTTTTSSTTTTLAPECLRDEDCGLAGWCRQGTCCGSYDMCSYNGTCFKHNFLRYDHYVCWNGMWRPATTTTIPTTTTSSTTTIITIPKRADGEECLLDSECASGDCMGEVCCSRGQCSYAKKCYKPGQTRVDGRICQADGSWRKPWGESCYVDTDCETNNCADGVCCNNDQCGDGSARICFTLGQISLDQTEVCMLDEEGKVGWKMRERQICRADSQCSTGNCADGICCLTNYCGYQGKCYVTGTEIDYGLCINSSWKT